LLGPGIEFFNSTFPAQLLNKFPHHPREMNSPTDEEGGVILWHVMAP
jgi:hypothetical protein